MPKEMPTPNPAHLDVVRSLCNRSPYQQLLGMQMTALELGRCRLEMPVRRDHMNPFGGLCGGAFASMLDIASYWCMYPQIPEDMGATTLDLQMNFLRAVTGGTLACEARVKKPGSNIFLCEADILDERGRIVANAASKMFLSPTIQPISAAVAAVDPSIDLPPKFL